MSAWGEQHLKELEDGECFLLNAVYLLETVEVAALFDFGLTPRHLKNSGETIGKFEKDNLQIVPLLQTFTKAVIAPKAKLTFGQPELLSYYKGNMNSMSDSEHYAGVLPNRRVSCYQAAGRCSSLCRSIGVSPNHYSIIAPEVDGYASEEARHDRGLGIM